MFSTGKRLLAIEQRLEALALRVAKLDADVQVTTPTQLSAELDDIRAAIDISRSSLRRELGALWAKLGGKKESGHEQFAVNRNAANDASFEALLDLQSRPPAGP